MMLRQKIEATLIWRARKSNRDNDVIERYLSLSIYIFTLRCCFLSIVMY